MSEITEKREKSNGDKAREVMRTAGEVAVTISTIVTAAAGVIGLIALLGKSGRD